MIILQSNANEDKTPLVFLFGVGLIGTAIYNSLFQENIFRAQQLTFDWLNPSVQNRALSKLSTFCKESASQRIEIIWSAGKAGFTADRNQVQDELSIYKYAIEAFGSIADKMNKMIGFTLISSAGGLFEGQRFVSSSTHAKPKRPYGELKLEQERILLENSNFAIKRIVRPSSVFGYIEAKRRMGLITTMIANGIMQRETCIYGRITTLRDYIFSDDIGKFLTHRLLFSPFEIRHETLLLASGKPSSIQEIILLIEKLLNKRLYISFNDEASNAEDITYAPNVSPQGWCPADLNQNIAKVINKAY